MPYKSRFGTIHYNITKFIKKISVGEREGKVRENACAKLQEIGGILIYENGVWIVFNADTSCAHKKNLPKMGRFYRIVGNGLEW